MLVNSINGYDVFPGFSVFTRPHTGIMLTPSTNMYVAAVAAAALGQLRYRT